MEVAAWQEELGISLSLEWAPREVNQHADDLTNGQFSAFDPSLCLATRARDVEFRVLTDFMDEAVKFYAEKSEAKRSRRQALNPARGEPQFCDRL
eukprot:2382494-Alexandrium_andersonii.AAC.1